MIKINTMNKYNLFKILFTTLFLSVLMHVQAQKSAEQLLKNVIDKTKSYKTMKVDLTYRMLNSGADENGEKKGTVVIMGDSFKLSMAGQLVICDGKTVWTYLEDSQEVMISNADKSEDAITPSSILTSYYEDYKASFANDKQNSAKGLKTIELKPDKVKKFVKIQIGINESKLQIANFAIFDNGGNTFIYDITKMLTDTPIAPSAFTFNKADFPGVDVVDMR
jgi:outer membrane lipoprotein carrier protein